MFYISIIAIVCTKWIFILVNLYFTRKFYKKKFTNKNIECFYENFLNFY